MTTSNICFRSNRSRNVNDILLFIIVATWSVCSVLSTPIIQERDEFYQTIEYDKPEIMQIPDCIYMELLEGHYQWTSPGTKETCGFYISTEPEKQVVISFDYADVSCADGGLISIVDGWELQGDFFPGIYDHPKPLGERFHEFCSSHKPRKHYVSSQNVAMIQYRIPTKGEGFQVRVNFIDNLTPCNVLLQEFIDIYTVRNYGQKFNCTVAAIFPSEIAITSMSVGIQGRLSLVEMETGTQSQCPRRGFSDYVEFIGYSGLDPTITPSSLTLCGLNSNPRNLFLKISCGNSAVRMISSGKFENSISVSFRPLEPEEMPNADISCE